MARTYRNSNKDLKVLDSKAISFNFHWGTWAKDERRPNRIKGGAIISCEEDEKSFRNIINGKYSVGVPKFYRKFCNKKQKVKMNNKMRIDLKFERYDDIGGEKLVKDAGWLYY